MPHTARNNPGHMINNLHPATLGSNTQSVLSAQKVQLILSLHGLKRWNRLLYHRPWCYGEISPTWNRNSVQGRAGPTVPAWRMGGGSVKNDAAHLQ